MSYPTKRDLDGVYFRVPRDGKWESVCYTDLTQEERESCVAVCIVDRTPEEQAEFWMNMANIMANTLRQVGDEFGIVSVDE